MPSNFSARKHVEKYWERFYRAMLCMHGTSRGPVSVCLCMCLLQVGVVLKRLNIGSQKQHHMIVQGI